MIFFGAVVVVSDGKMLSIVAATGALTTWWYPSLSGCSTAAAVVVKCNLEVDDTLGGGKCTLS